MNINNMFKAMLVFVMMTSFACKNAADGAAKIGKASKPSKENMQGSWKTDESAQADFKIAGDSMYFTEGQGQVFLYSIKDDSFTIHLPTYDFTYKAEVFGQDSIRLFAEQFMKTFKKINQ